MIFEIFGGIYRVFHFRGEGENFEKSRHVIYGNLPTYFVYLRNSLYFTSLVKLSTL